MGEIAYKSKSASVMLFLGLILSVAFAVFAIANKPVQWIICFIIFLVLAIVFGCSFFYQLTVPNCIIKKSGEYLWIYCKRKWQKIKIEDMKTIEYRNTQSGTIVLSSGTISIITNDAIFKLYNVKDVADVAFELKTI